MRANTRARFDEVDVPARRLQLSPKGKVKDAVPTSCDSHLWAVALMADATRLKLGPIQRDGEENERDGDCDDPDDGFCGHSQAPSV